MCVSCGCGEYDNDHGDERHLTMDDLKKAAEAAGTTVDEVGRNIQQAAGQPTGMPRE